MSESNRQWRKKRNREVAAKIGREVRARRAHLVMTQAQLASRVRGLDPSLLAKIERGEAGEKTPLGVWLDLAQALGWDLDRLLSAAGIEQ
jgi:ribosome-binding protein aMBF1 (putative translation factor)